MLMLFRLLDDEEEQRVAQDWKCSIVAENCKANQHHRTEQYLRSICMQDEVASDKLTRANA